MPGTKRNKKDFYTVNNILTRRFKVGEYNRFWTIDDTKFKFKNNSDQFSVLFIIDLATRKVINFLVTQEDFNPAHITRAVELLIKSHQIPEQDDINNRLVIHTDRDTHFSSKIWHSLQTKYEKKIVLSMSDKGYPKDNAVSERFHRTIKEMSIQALDQYLKNSNLCDYIKTLEKNEKSTKQLKSVVKKFVDVYNNEKIHSTTKVPPQILENAFISVGDKIGPPTVVAARNNETSPIEDRVAIDSRLYDVLQNYRDLLSENKRKKLTDAERFFLDYTMKVIQGESKKLAMLSQAQYEALEDSIDEVKEILNKLQKKSLKKKNNVVRVPLRDPLMYDTFIRIISYPIQSTNTNIVVGFARFIICTCLLYLTGCRINEIRLITLDDIEDIFKNKQLKILQKKTNNYKIVPIGNEGIEILKSIQQHIDFFFKIKNFKYLGCSTKSLTKPMLEPSFIRAFNTTMNILANELEIKLDLKSHSLRIGYVTRLLKKADIQETQRLIGHKSVATTGLYYRYTGTSKESREKLDSSLKFSQTGEDLKDKD